MSFMYNPDPYNDPCAVNKPVLSDKVIRSIVSGTNNVATFLVAEFAKHTQANPKQNLIVAFDGYISADWTRTVNLISQQLKLKSVELEVIDFAHIYKDSKVINEMFDADLEWDKEKDPTLLYGKIFHGGYEAIFDETRYAQFKTRLEELKGSTDSAKVVLVYGNGCAIKSVRKMYDTICFFDVTPKESILRVKRGQFANLGDQVARPANQVIRRCYYMDFEMALHLRGELLRENLLNYYLATDAPDDIQLLPTDSFNEILATLVKYPFRCCPVYLEGIWGGTYVKALRHLPEAMRNCAWVFDLIPMEVSVVVEAGASQVEFPFFTFVQKEGVNMMGGECVDKFNGYFPIRLNYDDTFHSSGNMSIQVHSGAEYNAKNFNELGRQDESYYVVVAGHHAKTYVGFNEGVDVAQFIKEIKLADTKYTPVDYKKYVSYEDSKPGLQVMIPAGTIHASGRNQVVLEIGSLTVGSYTYKLYDYLRADFDGKPRPIHTWHGERTLATERTTNWVRKNIVQAPREVSRGKDWAEYIVGEHDLVYFSLRRLEFETIIEGNTNGKFHVLTLVDGEKVKIRSKANPAQFYIQEYMDMVIIPADMGEYVVENLGSEPICIHKTMLKDGFANE